MKSITRRTFIKTASLALFSMAAWPMLTSATEKNRMTAKPNTQAAPTDNHWNLTEAEWRERLTPEQFRVLRKHGTERAFSSPLDKNWNTGTYHCAGCDLAVYASDHKFDSGTGWPSFYQAISADAIETSTDYWLLYPRTEVHCARCKGHFGHIFSDGPQPTGKRHCLNGVALVFRFENP